MCARAHTHIYVRKVRNASFSTMSLLPQFTVPLGWSLRSFEGNERCGGVEAKGKGNSREGGRGERGSSNRGRREKGDEREKRDPPWGGTFTGHLEFGAPPPHHYGIRGPLRAPSTLVFLSSLFPARSRSRVTPPRHFNRPPSRGKLV